MNLVFFRNIKLPLSVYEDLTKSNVVIKDIKNRYKDVTIINLTYYPLWGFIDPKNFVNISKFSFYSTPFIVKISPQFYDELEKKTKNEKVLVFVPNEPSPYTRADQWVDGKHLLKNLHFITKCNHFSIYTNSYEDDASDDHPL